MSDISGRIVAAAPLKVSTPEVEILTPARDRPGRETVIIRKPRGFMGTLAAGVSVCLVLLVGGWMAARLLGGDWLAPHRVSVHPDGTQIAGPKRDNLPGLRAGEVQLVLQDESGRIIRVAAQRREVENFEREMLFFLKRREESEIAAYQRGVSTAFDKAFADGDQAIAAYADWFFEWKRSWILMKEAVVGGANEFMNIFSPSKIWEGVTGRVRDYLMQNYESRVLQPDRRQPALRDELNSAFQAAHGRFRAVVDELGAREAAFIRDKTRLLQAYEAGSVTVALDWGAQKWKIPAHMAEDRAEAVYRSVAIMGAAVVVTPILAPIIKGVGERILGRVAGRIAAENSGSIIGAYLGPETWGLSFLVGAAVDYGWNKLDEHLNRENFIRDHKEALGETRAGWEGLTRDALTPVISSWYADTRTAMTMMGDKHAVLEKSR